MNKSAMLFSSLGLIGGLLIGFLVYMQQNQSTNHLVPFCAGEDDIVFSCAMHPYIQQSKRVKCPVCGMQLTSNQGSKYLQEALVQLSPFGAELAQIETQTVQFISKIEKSIQVDGLVKADESRVYKQIAHLPGRIEKLYINEPGVFVKKGQPIASMYSKELIAVIEAFEYSKTSSSVVRSAENNLKAWKIRKEQLKDFDIKSGKHHKPVDVYADFSGFITKKLAREGEYAVNTHMGAPTTFFEIADLNRVWVELDIAEQDLSWIKKGDPVFFKVPAYPERSFVGYIQLIAPTIDLNSRSAKARLEVVNTELLLKPGMLAEGEIEIEKTLPLPQLAIPESAVLWTGNTSVVYIKSPEHNQPVFEYREIQLGQKIEGHYLIENGLKAGEEVVINGAFKIDATAQLQRKHSVFNAPKLKKQSTPDTLIAKH